MIFTVFIKSNRRVVYKIFLKKSYYIMFHYKADWFVVWCEILDVYLESFMKPYIRSQNFPLYQSIFVVHWRSAVKKWSDVFFFNILLMIVVCFLCLFYIFVFCVLYCSYRALLIVSPFLSLSLFSFYANLPTTTTGCTNNYSK